MIRFEHVSKVFPVNRSGLGNGKTVVLDHVDLDIQKGYIWGLIGSSGSGKSTLGKLALGLETPDSGTVYYRDRELTSWLKDEPAGFRKKCQAIFQDPKASLSPAMTVRELLTETLRLEPGIPYMDYGKVLLGWLDKVGLPEAVLDRRPRQLSGGEAQRICIIRALLRNPEFLVCDEPTSGLDVATEWEIINLIKELQARHGLTVLFMTHNLYLLPALADMIAIMHQGKLVETGTVNQVFQNPAHDFTKLLVRNTLLKRAI